ncbi:uncharacterized protein LOC142666143 [Rhinoderma darwinii]|uniref:uncharacterized protein LOC142666143 n=1 Tax=Rhinoderma darwinii TaxID=43563 RepID=UPI003F6781A6
MDRRDSEPEPMETDQNTPDNTYNDNAEEKRQKKKQIRHNKEKQRENIMTSGNLFIITFKNLLQNSNAQKEVMCHYMERVLHSIFFFGNIYSPPISPDNFLPDQRTEKFKDVFPKPFSEYNTHLPRYTPYSILLEYMTESLKPENPDAFLKKLVAVNESLWKSFDEEGNQPIANDFTLTASVVTYCCVKDSKDAKVLKKAYGSSMSCKGKTERRIMIALSTLHVWDRVISYAVCRQGNGLPITFPEQVHCNAYSFITKRGGYEEIPPCTKCNKMYIVKFNPEHQAHNKEERWLYGNCAENEAFSKLLQTHKDVKIEICIRDDDGKKLMNREDIEKKFKEDYEDKMQREVKQLLTSRKFKFTSGEWKFFTPSYFV